MPGICSGQSSAVSGQSFVIGPQMLKLGIGDWGLGTGDWGLMTAVIPAGGVGFEDGSESTLSDDRR